MEGYMNKRNYQKELDRILTGLQSEKRVPRLLLHSCCAPCSSYVLEYLSEYFEITVYYYNPNIYPPEEYHKRVTEQQDLVDRMKLKNPVHVVNGPYDTDEFYRIAKGHEQDPEGGERCFNCYALRLREAAIVAVAGH